MARIKFLPLLFLLLSNPIHAQSVPDSCSSNFCLRPQGCRHCATSLLIQTAMGPATGDCFNGNWILDVEIGVLENISVDHAWGGTAFLQFSDTCGERFGARVIYRHWFSNQVGVDFSPGLVVYADQQQVPAFSGQVALDLAGLIAPVAGIDMIRQDGRVHWSFMAGVRGGSYLAMAGGVLLAYYAIAISDPDY